MRRLKSNLIAMLGRKVGPNSFSKKGNNLKNSEGEFELNPKKIKSRREREREYHP